MRYAVNTSGIARLTKFYTPLHQSQYFLVQKIFSLICSRPPGLCNFLDAPELEAFIGPKSNEDERWRVVYRSYATLYFVFVVDGGESELGVLDLIQVRVLALFLYRNCLTPYRCLWNRWTVLSRTFASWISYFTLMRLIFAPQQSI